MKLNIITRCTRPNNLLKIKQSIFKTNQFNIDWFIMFDTSVLIDIDTEILSQLGKANLRFIKGKSGDYGHGLINAAIDEIQSGLVYILDDDNIIHPDFYSQLYESLRSPLGYKTNYKGLLFNQWVGGKDFTKLDERHIDLNQIKVGHIDMAQFVLDRDLIGNHRLIKNEYTADGTFIEEIYSNNSEKFIFIDQVLSYYNYLSSNPKFGLPKVIYIGNDEPELKSNKVVYYESDDLSVTYLNSDSNIIDEINRVDPDVIITNSESFEDYKNLMMMPSDIRLRWIHLNNSENIGEIAYNCAMNYILNNDQSNMVSYFTPIYNTGDTLLRTYNSLKSQDNPNWEWVIVNDSSDGGKTLKIAMEISKLDVRVKVYDFREKSKGWIGESKYRAASLCRGQYLAELDHDDYLTPNCTSDIINAFKLNPEVGFVYSDCSELDESWNSLTYDDGFAFGYGAYRDEDVMGIKMKVSISVNINPMTIRHIVGVPNHIRVWRRDVYHKIGGHNRRLSIADDYELIVRTFLETKMMRIPTLCYIQFIYSNDNASNTHERSRADIQRRVRTIAEFYNEKIKSRFEELGLEDWAYRGLENPLLSESRFGDKEGYANLIYEKRDH